MATVEVTPASLTIHVEGLDRILALRTTITIPWEHVTGVHRDLADASVIFHGLKLPGTNLPGVVTAGSFLKGGDWSFWDVRDPKRAIIVTLRDEHYAKVVVGVDDPDETARQIEAVLRQA